MAAHNQIQSSGKEVGKWQDPEGDSAPAVF